MVSVCDICDDTDRQCPCNWCANSEPMAKIEWNGVAYNVCLGCLESPPTDITIPTETRFRVLASLMGLESTLGAEHQVVTAFKIGLLTALQSNSNGLYALTALLDYVRLPSDKWDRGTRPSVIEDYTVHGN